MSIDIEKLLTKPTVEKELTNNIQIILNELTTLSDYLED